MKWLLNSKRIEDQISVSSNCRPFYVDPARTKPKSDMKRELQLCKLLIYFVTILVLTKSALGQIIYFHFDAELDPIAGGDPYSTWSVAQSKVTRSNAVAHSGNFALRHEMDGAISNQTGKVIKFLNPAEAKGYVEAYHGAWYYIEQGFNDTETKNQMQWKTRNQGVTVPGGVKAVIGFPVVNGVRQLTLNIASCGVPDNTFPQYAANPRTPCKFTQFHQPIPIPDKQWFHVEVFFKATETNGHVIVWQDGVEIYDVTHPTLNTLTVFNPAKGEHSTNEWLYWGIGAYGNPNSNKMVLYTDDATVTDYPVHLESRPDVIKSSAPIGVPHKGKPVTAYPPAPLPRPK